MVPLIIYHPAASYPVREVAAQVRLYDVLPTVTQLLGVPVDRTVDGRSLVPLMNGEETDDRLAIAAFTKAGPARTCIRQHGYKWIRTTGPDRSPLGLKPQPPPQQLYDLTNDPRERVNLAGDHPALARTLSMAMRRALSNLQNTTQLQPPEVTDPALLERLKSLGYLGN
jgi:arylsulfatase A-like enzyme